MGWGVKYDHLGGGGMSSTKEWSSLPNCGCHNYRQIMTFLHFSDDSTGLMRAIAMRHQQACNFYSIYGHHNNIIIQIVHITLINLKSVKKP